MGIYPTIVCLILAFNTFGSFAEKEGSCVVPSLKNGFIYRDPPTNGNIYYSCKKDYKPVSGKWWGTATCIKGAWSNEPRCIEEDKCGVLPRVAHGHLIETKAGEVAEITCDPGFKSSFKFIGCINGKWHETNCKVDEQSCDSPPRVTNAVIISQTQERYLSGSHVIYKCHPGITMNGNEKVYCLNKVWVRAPTCEALCSNPLQRKNNAILINENSRGRKYKHGDTVRYRCDNGYESMGDTIAKCEVQTWIYPKCSKKPQCASPTKSYQFVTLSNIKSLYNNFEVLTYKCEKPYDKSPGGTLMCENEKWNGTIDCTSRTCRPPPSIQDGDIYREHKTGGVITSVSYKCQHLYVLSKSQKEYSCKNGVWDTPPKCLKPCKLTPEIYMELNIQPVLGDYIAHSGEEIKLHCKHGWNIGDWKRSVKVGVFCSDGTLKIDQKCDEKNYFSG